MRLGGVSCTCSRSTPCYRGGNCMIDTVSDRKTGRYLLRPERDAVRASSCKLGAAHDAPCVVSFKCKLGLSTNFAIAKCARFAVQVSIAVFRKKERAFEKS